MSMRGKFMLFLILDKYDDSTTKIMDFSFLEPS